jgi:hypothetical protein
MSTAAKFVSAKPSKHFCAMLDALLNASNDDYDERLDEVMEYVAAREAINNATDLQRSVTWGLRAKEKERAALRKQIAKLTRFDVTDDGNTEAADLGDWVSFYDVMAVVK